jgi:hypothetical protein
VNKTNNPANPHANMQTGGDEDMADKTNARKRPTLKVSGSAAAPGDGSISTVADIVNQLEPTLLERS